MRRPMAWLRFIFERALLRGLRYRLMLAVAVVATVAVVGGAIARDKIAFSHAQQKK